MTARQTIVAVSDDSTVIRSLTIATQSWANLRCVHDVARAAALLAAAHADALLVSDRCISMPNEGSQLRMLAEKYPTLPRVLITDYHQLHAILNAIHNGWVDRVLRLPVSADQLGAAIVPVVARSIVRDPLGDATQVA